MRKKYFFILLSLGVMGGCIKGIFHSIQYILTNLYIRHEMYTLITYNLQRYLNKWTVISIISSIALFVLSLVVLYIARNIWNLYVSRWIEIHPDRFPFNSDRVRENSLAFTICIIFFLCGGWAVNHYLLPRIHEPASLLGNAGILLFTLFLWWLLGTKGGNGIPVKIIERAALVCIVLLFVLNVYAVVETRIAVPEGPNVVFIIVDTLRADHLGCYGYGRNTSPNIDELSRDSIFFKHAISAAPWTSPSISSIFTSQYPNVLGYVQQPIVMDNKFVTLTEVFKENHYKTKGIISHIFLHGKLGFDQGFDDLNADAAVGYGRISSPLVSEKAISFIEDHKRDTFFLFLHYFDPHNNYILHEKFDYYPDYDGPFFSGQSIGALRDKAAKMSSSDIEYLKALYDSEISLTDEYIGKVIEKLKDLNLYDDTLIVLTADHGEEFLDRGDYWIGHTKKLYQEQIHVPLMIKLPSEKRKDVVEEFVGLIDLMPTIVDYAGLEMPPAYEYEGKVIDVKDREDLSDRIIVSETRRRARLHSAIYKGWKFIYDSEFNVPELMYLMEDQGELNNLAATNRGKAAEMQAILREWRDSVKAKKSGSEQLPSFTEQQKAQLRALGYIN
jgi:arylsulfatase A-like enzyme